jgi:hypothetical protein
MGIELREFHDRLLKKCTEKDKRLKALYDTVCPVDAGVLSPLGTCTVYGRQVHEPPEPDPIPDDVLRPVDPEKVRHHRIAARDAARTGQSQEWSTTLATGARWCAARVSRPRQCEVDEGARGRPIRASATLEDRSAEYLRLARRDGSSHRGSARVSGAIAGEAPETRILTIRRA